VAGYSLPPPQTYLETPMNTAFCPNCNHELSSLELTNEWCETCGKRIPLYVLRMVTAEIPSAAARTGAFELEGGSIVSTNRTSSLGYIGCSLMVFFMVTIAAGSVLLTGVMFRWSWLDTLTSALPLVTLSYGLAAICWISVIGFTIVEITSAINDGWIDDVRGKYPAPATYITVFLESDPNEFNWVVFKRILKVFWSLPIYLVSATIAAFG
jgi:hypothetical protein